jgi:hypothetical protein
MCSRGFNVCFQTELVPLHSGVPGHHRGGGRDSLVTLASGGGSGTGLPPAPHRHSSVIGFGDAIINALAEKRLDEAKRTKKDLMEERMKGRLNRAGSQRGAVLQRAASKRWGKP